jgi:hypothetical protein
LKLLHEYLRPVNKKKILRIVAAGRKDECGCQYLESEMKNYQILHAPAIVTFGDGAARKGSAGFCKPSSN